MKILLTGASGFIGSEVLARLLKNKVDSKDIILLGRKKPDRNSLLARRLHNHQLPANQVLETLQFVQTNFEDRATFINTLRDLKSAGERYRVIHLAAVISTAHVAETKVLSEEEQKALQRRVNLGSTVDLLEWAQSHADLFIFTSSVVAFGGIREPRVRSEADFEHFHEDCRELGYFVSKREAHEYVVAHSKIPTLVACPSIVHGAFDSVKATRGHLKALREGRLMWAPPGGGNFVNLDRVAGAIVEAALEVKPQGVQTRLLVDQNMSYEEYFNLYLKLFNGHDRTRVRRVPLFAVRAILGAMSYLPMGDHRRAKLQETLGQSSFFLYFKSEYPLPPTAGIEAAIRDSLATLA